MVKSAKILRVFKPGKAAPVAITHKAASEPHHGAKLMIGEMCLDLSTPGAKKFDVIKEGDKIVDYLNVRLSGYLSTFKDTTESDRQGDYVEKGAFTETIPHFMQNPVLLKNHSNKVEDTIGRFDVLREDSRGLYFEATLSNSPSDAMKDVRAKVADGTLKATSMGGIFHYKPDGRGIFKVDLMEGSVVPIPANPDALFSVRALTESESKEFQAKAA